MVYEYPEALPESAENSKRVTLRGQWKGYEQQEKQHLQQQQRIASEGDIYWNPESIEYEVPPEIPPEKCSPPPPLREESSREGISSSAEEHSTSRYRTSVATSDKPKYIPRAPDRSRNNFRLSSMLDRDSKRNVKKDGSVDKGSSTGSVASSNDSRSSGSTRRQRLMARMKSLSTRSMASLERQRVVSGPSDGIQKTAVSSVQERTTSSVRSRRTKEELRRSVRQQRLQRILAKRSERRLQPSEDAPEDSARTALTNSDTSELEEEGNKEVMVHDVTLESTYESAQKLQTQSNVQGPVGLEEEKKEIEEITCGQLRYSTKQDDPLDTSAVSKQEAPPHPEPLSPMTAARQLRSSLPGATIIGMEVPIPPPVPTPVPSSPPRAAFSRSMSMSALVPPPSRSIMKKTDSVRRLNNTSVRFDRIELREFDRTIGDNPSVSCGIPIQLDWNYTGTSTQTLDDYEESRLPNRRPRIAMALAPETRQEMLLKEWGVTFRELHQTASQTDNIKQQRYVSATQTPYQARVEEALETTKRRVSRVIKGDSKKKEQERLWEHASRALDDTVERQEWEISSRAVLGRQEHQLPYYQQYGEEQFEA